ncbi:DUF6493 family protein [Dactylosporangium sp. NPDC051541]|uniref:DUF6493 family protein n=1 Tax=Dactylosporangium sp. NPDC051541 TaxID=3363977 RepID=UPI00379998F1
MIDYGLIADGKVADVSAAVAALDERERPAAFKGLEAYLKASPELRWLGEHNTALAVAAVGTAPSAAAATRVLSRRTFFPSPGTGPAVLAAARDRGITWLPDLVRRVGDKRGREPFGGLWAFLAELLAAGSAPAPAGDWFVLGWLDHLNYPAELRARSAALPERLRADPFLDDLVPRLFTTDRAGERMLLWAFNGRPGGELALVEGLATLSAEGRLDRPALITATLSRLLRGGDRRQANRAFVALLTALAPTPDEVAANAADYLRLLADAPVTVATAAQKALRKAPDLELDAVLEASRAVLRRPDKTLVRTQLTWLAALRRRHPDRESDIAATAAEALDHPLIDVRERAAALTPPAAASPAAAPPAAVSVALPAAPEVAPAPPPITDPDELAEEVAAFYSHRPFSSLPQLERVLDATVRLAATDRAGLRTALLPVLDRHTDGTGEHSWDPNCLCGVFARLLRTAADPQAAPPRSAWAALMASARRFLPQGLPMPGPRMAPPQRLLWARLTEIGLHVGVGNDRTGGLVSAPTAANGALDTAVLLDRLAALGGREPWPWDLSQALLRLPPTTDSAAAARAAALGTAAGSRVAAWLRDGGLPAPQWQVEVVPRRPKQHGGDYEHRSLPVLRVQVTTAAADGETFELLGAAPPAIAAGSFGWHVLWPGLLPWHRGLAAAFALPEVASAADLDQRGGGAVLPLLAEASGDGGPALPIAVAYGLAARHESDRLAAVDALLVLAAGSGPSNGFGPFDGSGPSNGFGPFDGSDGFDAETAGRYLGLLAAGGVVVVNRAVQPLRDAAAAGAARVVFRLLRAALPELLTVAKLPPGTPDLLTLAAETAATASGGVPVEIAGLEAVAGRRGSSRLVQEARRLRRALV